VRRFFADRSGVQRVGVLAAVAVLLTAPFGGLAKAQDDPETLELEHTYDIGQFEVRLDNVVSLGDLAPAVVPDPGLRLLVLDVAVTNPNDEAQPIEDLTKTWSGKATGAVPWGEDEAPRLRAFTVDDATELDPGEMVNPGQTMRVALVLQQVADWDPAGLSLELYASHFKEDPFTLSDGYWVVDELVASGPIAVEVQS
jgi:hypothetical protein